MSTENTGMKRFGTTAEAVHAVNEMQRLFLERMNVALVGKDNRPEERVPGSYNLGNRIKRR